jgi:hypothetical protein
MLLDPLEEQFDSPSAFVQLGDDERGQKRIVGQENETLLRVGIVVSNTAQRRGVELGRIKTLEANGLIAAQARSLVD